MSNPDFVSTTLDMALDSSFFAAMLTKRTSIPGRVVSWNPDLQTITAEPMISLEGTNGTRIDIPPVTEVMTIQIGGGNFVLTFNPAPGDFCLLLVADRCIDAWYETGEKRIPADNRQMNISDCVAIVGLRPKPSAIKGYLNGAALRRVDGMYYIHVGDDNNITIKGLKVTVDCTEMQVTGTTTFDKDILVRGNTSLLGNVDSTSGNANFTKAKIGGVEQAGHKHKENGTGGGITDGPQVG